MGEDAVGHQNGGLDFGLPLDIAGSLPHGAAPFGGANGEDEAAGDDQGGSHFCKVDFLPVAGDAHVRSIAKKKRK